MSCIIAEAKKRRASDVHITAGRASFWRVDGCLQPDEQGLYDLWLKEKEILEELAQQGAIRVSQFMDEKGENISIRFFAEGVPDFDALGLPEAARALKGLREGLVLFAGPTGSGKTTSALSLLQEILSQEPRHAITIEDPLEGDLSSGKGLLQRLSVGKHCETMEEAVYDSLRYDADVLLVGEIRRGETLKAALLAAETGHLVLSTLHANRIVDIVPTLCARMPSEERESAYRSLIEHTSALVCQRLLPKVGGGRWLLAEVLPMTESARAYLRKDPYSLRGYLESLHHSQGISFEKHAAFGIQSGAIAKDKAIPGIDLQSVWWYLPWAKKHV